MVLGFKPQFEPKIMNGTKKHTIREDANNRWRVGMAIHFATGVRTKKYKEFKKGKCNAVCKIEIEPSNRQVMIVNNGYEKVLQTQDIERLAKDDGFDTVDEFFKWFNKPFKGKIIFWAYSPLLEIGTLMESVIRS